MPDLDRPPHLSPEQWKLNDDAGQAIKKLSHVSQVLQEHGRKLVDKPPYFEVLIYVERLVQLFISRPHPLLHPAATGTLEDLRTVSAQLSAVARSLMRAANQPSLKQILTPAVLKQLRLVVKSADTFSRVVTALQLHNALSGPGADPSVSAAAERPKPGPRVPKQVPAPIMTGIEDDRLIALPGPPIAASDAERYKSEYLAKQLISIIAALRGSNQSKAVIAAFTEARAQLEGWSTARLLAFGAHLHLLEKYSVGVRQEVMDDVRHQIDAWMDNARQFVTSFDEWHAYMERPIARAERANEITEPVRGVVGEAAQALGKESEAVEHRIPTQLDEFRDLMAEGNTRQTRLIGLVSSLRSMLNISISFVRYKARASAKGLNALLTNPRVVAMMRTICAFLPFATKLAAFRPDFAFLIDRKEELKLFCEGLKNSKAI